MKANKFLILISFVLLSLISLFACDKAPSYDEETTTSEDLEQKYVPNEDPEPYEITLNQGDFLGIYTETEYDQIVATPTKEVFSMTQDTYLSCDVANHNVGHGFVLYEVVYIDKYIDGEWVRQCNKYAADAPIDFLTWHFVGVDKNVDGINSTRKGILLTDIYPVATPGKYRFVIFTPKSTLYAEFELQE